MLLKQQHELKTKTFTSTGLAMMSSIPGLVFNAKDGSVKILCSGEDSVIDNFKQTIRIRGAESGAKIKGITEISLPFNIDLPDEFSKVSSDDEFDIGRKLDKRVPP